MSWDMLNIIFAALTAILMLIGIIGTIVPRVPGLPLLWTSIVVFAIATKFTIIDVNILILITALIALEILLDVASSLRGTRQFTMNFWGVVGALAGVFVASGFRSIPLLILLPLSGVIVGQLISGHDALYKVESEGYTMIGYVGGTLIKAIIGFAILGIFVTKIVSSA